MKKTITLVASKKLPIPGVAYSNVEASAHFTMEYESDIEDSEEWALEHAKEMLAKCLQASMEVANNTEPPKSVTISDVELNKLGENLTNKDG